MFCFSPPPKKTKTEFGPGITTAPALTNNPGGENHFIVTSLMRPQVSNHNLLRLLGSPRLANHPLFLIFIFFLSLLAFFYFLPSLLSLTTTTNYAATDEFIFIKKTMTMQSWIWYKQIDLWRLFPEIMLMRRPNR